jgi:hypothetical protein
MLKFKTHTFNVPASWTREQLQRNIRSGLVYLAVEVKGYAYREAYDFVTSHYEVDEAVDDYALYDSCKCTRGMKREDRGIVTRHGIINSLHCYNDRARDRVHHGEPVLPGVELYHDTRGGKFAHDYYFKTTCPAPDGEDYDLAELLWVLNSRRVTKMLEYYNDLNMSSCPMPKKLVI